MKRILPLALTLAVGVTPYAACARSGDEAAPQAAAAGASPATAPATEHGANGHHPAPRTHVGSHMVDDPGKYARHPRLAAAYQAAAENPQLLDGLYCYCDCAEHAGHYSLLSCYETDHAAMCDICLNAAEMAFKLHRDGVGLDGIRDVIDATYGS